MKTSYITFVAPFLAALLAPAALASPVKSYPGCQATNDAAKIGDETALKNAIAACQAAGATGATGGTGNSSDPDVATSAAASGCYDCGPASQWYNPGCHCENTLYTS